jgi:hypothetical protein
MWGRFSDRNNEPIRLQAIDDKIKSLIYGYGRGKAYTPDRFLGLGSRTAVDKALSRLAAQGTIERLARGLYHYPMIHPQLGKLLPAPEEIAKALAGREKVRIQPSGAYAANLLGLSTQVPAKVVFLTDGRSRTVMIAKMTIQLRNTTPRNMAAAGKTSGLVIQAFRHLGKEHVTQQRIDLLKLRLSREDKARLVKDIALAPTWMHPIFREISAN